MKLSDPILFERRCDASAGIALNADAWVGANDEDNALQLYSVAGGAPLDNGFLVLDEFLKIEGEPGKREADLESATQIGDVIWWIGSHAQSKSGKPRPNRHRLFATRITPGGAAIRLEPYGKACQSLRKAMLDDNRLKKLDLETAAGLPPKEEGGFNIEAICADSAGERLWVGFRNPIPKGRALLVPLEKLAELAEGKKPTLGAPELVDLGGLGFRDMIYAGGEYLILAGDFRDRNARGAQPSALFTWSGPGAAPQRLAVGFGDLNPEALIAFPDQRILIVSDDGARKVAAGETCKELKNEDERTFRAAWLSGP